MALAGAGAAVLGRAPDRALAALAAQEPDPDRAALYGDAEAARTTAGTVLAVALIVGTAEGLGLFADQFGWRGGVWDWIAGLDLNVIGFVIVGMFLATWLVAMLVWRVGRIEDRWSAPVLSASPNSG